MEYKATQIIGFYFSICTSLCQTPEHIIGQLSQPLPHWNLLINDSVVYTIEQTELFYYYPKHETACTVNKMTGYVPLENVTHIDSLKYIRFSFHETDLAFEEFHEDLILAKRQGLGYEHLVQQAIHLDGQALKDILKLEPFVDGGASEMFADRYWKIIHFWPDKELSELIESDSSGFRKHFFDFMTNEFYTGFTVTEIEEYLSLFYPRTLSVMKLK